MMIFLLVFVVGFLLVGGMCPAEMIRFFVGFRDGRVILARLAAMLTVARDVAQLQRLD